MLASAWGVGRHSYGGGGGGMGGLLEGGRKRGHLPEALLVFPSGLSTRGECLC